MSGSEIKVTDKRMFTPTGELREEYRHLEEGGAAEEPAPPPEPAAPEPAAPRSTEAGTDRADEGSASRPPLELPDTSPELGGPSFLDLVGLLAEPATVYLGEAPLPDGRRGEDLEMARVHIDLLGVLRQKTLGNLSSQETAILDDVIYRLRLRYVQKRG